MDELAVAENENGTTANDNSEIIERELVFSSLRLSIGNNNVLVRGVD
jgi:hypothetical protein